MNSRTTNLYPKINPSVSAMKMLSVGGSVVKLTDGGYTFDEKTRYISLDVQDNDVYVAYHDATPSATVGHILYAGNSYTWDVDTAKAASFIQVGSAAVIAASQFTD